MDADKIDQMKSGLKKIQAQVNEMSGTAQALGERLERAEQFVMKLGWCPWCQKRLRPRGKTPMGGFDRKLCACKHETLT